MATVQGLIVDALKVIGVAPAGATSVDAAYAADGLAMVTRMLDAWNAERLLLATVARSTVTWTASQSSRTIAASGADLASQRPEWIDHAGVIPSGDTNEIPIDLLTREQYARIVDKTITSTYFTALWYEATFPSGTLTVYPVPTTAPTLVLYVPTAITSAVALTTTLSYAPGYEEAIQYQLARRLAPIFRQPWTNDLKDLADEALGRAKRANVRVEPIRADPALSPHVGGTWNILIGDRNR